MKLPTEITATLERQNGMITSRDISAMGVSRTMLGKYVSAGLIERAARGVYVRVDGLVDELFALHKRCGRLVFSHATALFLLGKSERTPFKHYVSICAGETIPATLRADVECFYVRKDVFKLGLTATTTAFGNKVLCYDLERTICDLVRNRSRMDEELLISTIREYAQSKERNLVKLGEYAERLGIFKKLSTMMEIAI